MGYSSVDSVKRILRVLDSSSNNQYKVRMSDSYDLPESYSSNSGDIGLSGIDTISSSYAGSEFWSIKFTSSTGFTLYRGEGETLEDGTGSISSTFTSTSGIIKISSDDWYGTAAAGDKIKFRTSSNISEDDADEFISDADAVIDGILNKVMEISSLPKRIPTLIEKASMYLSANLIFQSVFSNVNTDNLPAIVRRWHSFAIDLVNSYLEGISGKALAKYSRYGRFQSREPLFEKVGIDEASGIEGFKGEVDAVNEEYDTDYNNKESLGAT